VRRPTITVIAATVAGCATAPIPDAETSLVPRDRVLNPAYLEAEPNTGVVAVKRDPGLMAGGCKFEILVDAQPVAQLKTSERVVLHLPVGDHNLGCGPSVPWGRGEYRRLRSPYLGLNLRE
jgi:hypothetical protein